MDPASPELKALLQRCREAPADDLPRLVLADWLDEHGDADRAAFVRVQLALSHPSADTVQHGQLKALEQTFIQANFEAWVGELQPILNGLRYGSEANRGLTAFAPRIATPGRALNLTLRRGCIQLRHLDPTWLSDPALRAWLRSPAGDWLEQIGLVGMTPDAFERLDLPPECYGRIRILLRKPSQEFADFSVFGPGRLSSHDDLAPHDWQRFFRNPNFNAIRSLAVESGLPFLRELGQTDVGRLVELEFRSLAENAEIARILATISFRSLSGLDFGPVSEGAMRSIVASPYLRNLAEWNLIGSPLGDGGMRTLCESPLAQSLRSASFPNTGIGDDGLEALVRSPIFEHLNSPSLNLMMNRIGDRGVTTLAESEHLLRYREIVLRENNCGDRGAADLAASASAANLTHIDFWRNRIGDAGAAALSQSPHLGRIVDLCLKENRIGPDGEAALFEGFGDRVKV